MKKVIMTVQPDLHQSASKRRQTSASVAPRVLTKKRKMITRRVIKKLAPASPSPSDSNTNQVTEGTIDVDLDELYPGYKCEAELTQRGTNGLCQIDFLVVRPGQQLELQSHFLIYLPNMKQGALNGSLPKH